VSVVTVDTSDAWGLLRLRSVAEAARTELEAALTASVLISEEVEAVQETLQLISEFVRRWGNILRPTQRIDTDQHTIDMFESISLPLVIELDNLRPVAQGIANSNPTDDGFLPGLPKLAEDHNQALNRRFVEFLRRLAAFLVENRLEGVGGAQADLIDAYAKRIELKRITAEAEAARDRTVEAAIASENAAGISGTASLAAYFKGQADRESRLAEVFRVGVIITLFVVGVASYRTASSLSDTAGLLEVVRHLSYAVPVGLLAIYLSRQSAYHRDQAAWARSLEVQLDTLEAYIAPLDDVDKSKLRAEFGQRVFGARCNGHAEDGTDAALPQVSELLDKLSQLVTKLGDIVKPGK
jgi:hypothetical protein